MEDSVWKDPAVLAAAESQPGLVPLQLNTDSEGGEQFRRLFPVERTPCVQFISPPTAQQPGGRVVRVLTGGPCAGAPLLAADVATAISEAMAELQQSLGAGAQAAVLAALLSAAAVTASTTGGAGPASAAQSVINMQVDHDLSIPTNSSAAQAGGTAVRMTDEERKEKVAAAAARAQQNRREEEARRAKEGEISKPAVEGKREEAEERAADKQKLEDEDDRRRAAVEVKRQLEADQVQRRVEKAARQELDDVAGVGGGRAAAAEGAGATPAADTGSNSTSMASTGMANSVLLQFRLLDGSTFRCQVCFFFLFASVARFAFIVGVPRPPFAPRCAAASAAPSHAAPPLVTPSHAAPPLVTPSHARGCSALPCNVFIRVCTHLWLPARTIPAQRAEVERWLEQWW